MSVPFHKQLDPNKQAGQHVYGFDREPYLKHSNVAPDITLSDYIKRKEEGPPRITFDEWLQQQIKETGYEDPWQDSHAAAEDAWNAALTKGKL